MGDGVKKDHCFDERGLGFLLVFVCVAEKAASGGWGIHGVTELRNYGKRGTQDIRNHESMELRR